MIGPSVPARAWLLRNCFLSRLDFFATTGALLLRVDRMLTDCSSNHGNFGPALREQFWQCLSLGCHAHGGIYSDGLAVQHVVFYDVLHQARVFLGPAQAGRKERLLAQ
jgi:hypothetical protein